MIAVPTAIPEVLKIQNPQGKLVRVVLGEVFDVAVDLRKRTKILSQKPWRPRFCVFPNRGVLRHELNACGGLNPISHPTGSESPSVFTPNTNLPCPAKTNSSAKFCASGR
jgi:hypothetical protein